MHYIVYIAMLLIWIIHSTDFSFINAYLGTKHKNESLNHLTDLFNNTDLFKTLFLHFACRHSLTEFRTISDVGANIDKVIGNIVSTNVIYSILIAVLACEKFLIRDSSPKNENSVQTRKTFVHLRKTN